MSNLEARLGIDGRRFWVVGAGGGGIGTAVTAELAGGGAQVVAIDRDREALEATLAAGEGVPGSIEPVVLDASDGAAVNEFAEQEFRGSNLPHGLVNIVGGLHRDQFGAIVDTPEATLDAVLRLNLRASWLASQALAKGLLAAGRGGSVVQLASIAALQGMPFGATYAMAKAALISLSRSQALEWGPRGIRVNTIAAGTIRTPRAVSTNDELDRRVIPLGRRGHARDIAGTALFLLSDLAEWVTGQVISVDGGVSIKPAYLGDDGLPVFVEDDALRERLFAADPIEGSG
jgi:NAD(P)-dependent dehydrogenase (short-subunit alcohol dehydrogenase family)